MRSWRDCFRNLIIVWCFCRKRTNLMNTLCIQSDKISPILLGRNIPTKHPYLWDTVDRKQHISLVLPCHLMLTVYGRVPGLLLDRKASFHCPQVSGQEGKSVLRSTREPPARQNCTFNCRTNLVGLCWIALSLSAV